MSCLKLAATNFTALSLQTDPVPRCRAAITRNLCRLPVCALPTSCKNSGMSMAPLAVRSRKTGYGYWTARHQGNRKYVSLWRNKNAGDVTKWTYDPDYSHQALDDGTWKNTSLRITWQVSRQNKVNLWWDEQSACHHCIECGDTTTNVLQLLP